MDRKLPTFGQLERQLSQSIQKLYREDLGHSPKKVTCKFFKNQLSIVIEDALTAVEKALVSQENENQTIENLNSAINDAIKLKLKTIIETVLAVEVDDILFSSNIDTMRAGAIVILSQLPQIRNQKPSPIIRQNNSKNEEEAILAETNYLSSTELKEEYI